MEVRGYMAILCFSLSFFSKSKTDLKTYTYSFKNVHVIDVQNPFAMPALKCYIQYGSLWIFHLHYFCQAQLREIRWDEQHYISTSSSQVWALILISIYTLLSLWLINCMCPSNILSSISLSTMCLIPLIYWNSVNNKI